MKKFLIVAAFSALTLTALTQDKVINDNNAVTRSARDFHAIEVGDGIDVYLTQSNEEAVAVSASKTEYRNKITTTVENGVLKIYYGTKNDWKFGWNNNRRLKAYISFKMLDRLSASGGSDVSVSGTIKASGLSIDLSGGSDFNGSVEVEKLEFEASGGSDVTIRGKATNLKIDASGGSDFRGFDLSADYCYAEASGGSDMQIRVNKELVVDTSGGSDVYYKGGGVLRESKTSGGGVVSRRD